VNPRLAIVALAVLSCSHLGLLAQSCHSENGLPDSECTPGAVRTTDAWEVCHGGSTRRFRPPSSFTRGLERQQIEEYGYADTYPGDYEMDHLIPLEIGGAGSDPRNLWPESHADSHDKDLIENYLHRQICSGAMSVTDAQRGIAVDWRQYLPQVRRRDAGAGHLAIHLIPRAAVPTHAPPLPPETTELPTEHP
jgi:hypothetical protein